MCRSKVEELKSDIETLKRLAVEYPTHTITNVIGQLSARLKELDK